MAISRLGPKAPGCRISETSDKVKLRDFYVETENIVIIDCKLD